MLHSDDVERAVFATQMKGRKAVIRKTQVDERIPHQYRAFQDVFSDQESKRYPPKRPWDHQIELKAGAPATLISKNIPLSVTE